MCPSPCTAAAEEDSPLASLMRYVGLPEQGLHGGKALLPQEDTGLARSQSPGLGPRLGTDLRPATQGCGPKSPRKSPGVQPSVGAWSSCLLPFYTRARWG